MASVFDVAQYILKQNGAMTAMKLQKLIYYSQAWHIAWTDNVLFDQKIEAWVDGPVCRELFNQHKGAFRVSSIRQGNEQKLSPQEKDTINRVLAFYGDKFPQWLSDLTHMEDPWREARAGIPAGASGSREITPESMLRYYSALQ